MHFVQNIPFKMVIRALTSGIANGICRGILASKHKTRTLPSLVLVKNFTIVLQYHLTFMTVL